MAPPRKKIDVEQVRKLAAIHCTNEEIASIVGCSKDTLERRCAAILKDGRAAGKMSLKRKQYELAMSGNVTMLIWLGKILLGQREENSAVTINNHQAATSDSSQAALNEIREILKAKECSSMPTPPLSLVSSQGLLGRS